MKRIASSEGVDPAASMSLLAKEMMTIKKRSTSLELMHISLNDQGIRFVATPALLEACCSGILHSKKEGHPPPFSPFNVASSFRGTRLEDWDMPGVLNRAQDNKSDLTEAERELLLGETILVAGTASQLTKVLKIFATLSEEYVAINAVVSRFCVEMYNWVKDNEEKISIVSSTKDALIAPKIQSLISELLQEYFEEARFHVPEPELLDMSSYKKTILRSPQTLTLLPAIDRILNPIKTNKHVDRSQGGGGGGGGTRGDTKKGGQIKFDEHKE